MRKLSLDVARPKLPKLVWVLLVVSTLSAAVYQIPARWLEGVLASRTGCKVMLYQAAGGIWQGSAALAFSEPNGTDGSCREPRAVTERFGWKSACDLFSLSCHTKITFVALDKPQQIVWGFEKIAFSANEIKLPASVLEGLGNPWSTLRPRGQLEAHWSDLILGGISGARDNDAAGLIRISLNNISSPISPVKPLGSYEISANLSDEGLSWTISTTGGSLLLSGQGDSKSGAHFIGQAQAIPEMQEALIGLLSLLGKKEGDVYRLKF